MPFYRLVLQRALKLSWRHKPLWVLGFFAAFISNGSLYQFLTRSFSHLSEGGTLFSTLFEYYNSGIFGLLSFSLLRHLWLTDFSAFGMLLFSILLGFSVIFLMLTFGLIGQAGAIWGLLRAEEGQTMGLRQSFRHGTEKFWPVLEINFFTKVVLFGALVMIIYAVSLILPYSGPLQTLLYVAAFTFFVVCSVIIYFLTFYATAYVVLRGAGAWAALRQGFNLFRRAVWLNLEIGLLLFVLSLAAAIVFVAFSLLVSIPFVIVYLFAMNWGWNWLLGITGLSLVFLLAAAAVIFGAWYNTFQLAVWAILFEEQTAGRASSKARRVAEELRKKIVERREKIKP